MKKILTILSIVLYANLYACTGDCMSCHPSLMPTIHDDPRHKPMLTCIKCHTKDIDDIESMAECGSDCFACHSIEKLERNNIFEHKVIRSCRDCHLKMKEEVVDFTTPTDQSYIKPLDNLLFP